MAQRIESSADVVEFLLEQHNRIRQLFAETAAAAPEDREEKFVELRRLLAVHETAEEEIVHPRARRVIDHGKEIVDARLEEENKAKHALAELESIDVSSPEFTVKLAKLRDAVLNHAGNEESEEFQQLRVKLDQSDLERMRRIVEFAEKTAPTRPHPGVESAAANMLVGPFASMLDRARDAISKP
ncbi:hemerythrin domain-containing protein [Nocardia sp. CDC159]|uniref:Hemerythrin domain-containing protein n=1 Tax=Nocardia pulmonis TaxID=2951408 RepID=A0A9X2EFM6_9NOCA|nr:MULTISPECIES: hemerythrin domain-containing protein [Nocardia]MCM6778605.1 hemerythrin domain-containing protein [Nocardia pulmonis]MCM6791494.1 hemerythrin domain-containing protein [Nocardia sp. CDC159]